MSKELEARNQIYFLKGMLSTLLEYVNFDDLEVDKIETGEKINNIIKDVVEALTPPTADEVCEEIGYYFYKCVGWMNAHVEYDKVNKSFIVEHDDKKQTYCELIENIQTIQFYTDTPIFIAKHIAQFYKSLKEAQDE